MHQTLPGSSRAKPTSQYLPSVPSGVQLATFAVTLTPPGSSSRRTGVPGSSGREIRAPHPCGFTIRVWQCSENESAGSTLTMHKGIWARIRAPLRAASWVVAMNFMVISVRILKPKERVAIVPAAKSNTKVTISFQNASHSLLDRKYT